MTTTETQPNSTQSRRPTSDNPRIAVIGCGAIAELYHLPALQEDRSVIRNVVLVDNNTDRTAELAGQFGIKKTVTDYREILGDIDGAIVATPPHSHYPICLQLLQQGISVLCEKPLVNQATDAHELVRKADETGAVLCVNHTRRLFQAYGKVHEMIHEGVLGELRSIEYVDGEIFNWPTATGFYFKQGARGVLFDRGIHSLDLICWWLGAKPELVRSRTDSFGGPESLALLEMVHGSCQAKIKLSWLTKLQNYYRVSGTKASVEGGIEQWGSLKVTHASGKSETVRLPAKEIEYSDFGTKMLANFVSVLRGKARPAVPACEVLGATELIDEAYEKAEVLELPWLYGAEV